MTTPRVPSNNAGRYILVLFLLMCTEESALKKHPPTYRVECLIITHTCGAMKRIFFICT